MATTLNERGIATVPHVPTPVIAPAQARKNDSEPAATPIEHGEPRYMPLSRTTDRVLQILLRGDLSRIRSAGRVGRGPAGHQLHDPAPQTQGRSHQLPVPAGSSAAVPLREAA